MESGVRRPFRGSEAVRAGELTRGELFGPRHRRVGRDTYVAADTPTTALGRIDAALTAAGPSAVAIGWSACVVLGLDVASGPTSVEIGVGDRQPRSRPGVLVRYCRLPDPDVRVEDGRRTTTPLRTAFDLARRTAPVRGVDHATVALPDVVAAVDALGRLGGTVLDAYEHEVPHGTGRRTLRLDLAWPQYGVAVEYDGKDHARADRRGRDIDRLDELRRQGWFVVVVTAVQIARPHWVADRVREALALRGWAA